MRVSDYLPATLYAGKTVFVTGGGSGINLGVARNFAALGASVEGATRDAFEAILLALAAGTFAYVAIVDILREEHESTERLKKWLVASAGTALMAALAPFV